MRAHQYPLRWFRSLACIALAFTCFLLIAAQPGLAQVDQGAISGLITDPTGAVVSNAQVTLTNLDNGLVLQTTSSSSGEYHLLAGQDRKLQYFRHLPGLRHHDSKRSETQRAAASVGEPATEARFHQRDGLK